MALIDAPSPATALGDSLRRCMAVPGEDREARAERRILRRLTIKEAVRGEKH